MTVPIKLTQEDRKKFQEGLKTMKPAEILELMNLVDNWSGLFTNKDLRFMKSCIGKRCERLLRNAVKNFSFDDKK